MDNRQLNTFLNNKDLQSCGEMWKKFNLNPMDVCTQEWGILSIRYLLMNGDSCKAVSLYHKLKKLKQVKKRSLMILLSHFVDTKNFNVALYLFEENLSYFEFEGIDFYLFLKFPHSILLKKILPLFLGKGIFVEPGYVKQLKVPSCHIEEAKSLNLQKVAFRKDEMLSLFNFFHKKTNCHPFVLQSTNIRFIIDGANVFFYQDRAYEVENGIKRLLMLISYLKKTYNVESNQILLVLHIRHEQVWPDFQNRCQLLTTPYNKNDDWFFIRSALFLQHSHPNLQIISNDKMRDHVDEMKNERIVFETWYAEQVIRFSIDINIEKVELFFSLPWSQRVQENDQYFLIPTTNEKTWLTILKKKESAKKTTMK